ncbi:phosphoadenylyl-sulfate reductase [Candidatus Falkowbacteria bacterium CG10_big_fil_rev_8_21_14_0_10_43_10]|uniref:Phosphoadenosine 5'-phosphosulfate reductase n=1 Tax=Candidatus Falkowbacteria bacterium CG10_big_fil_rev_8_21_14_0_10_43_10 TaxID=1974567 RepID=A0A2H0V239_9BACT|nr:MAG: phosphoadenylyl-sulfate reductase [Candidatus Falkowbacteria bacterium CG10_big_fil_rev_8_21_14_0_10_43_10]
MKLSEKIELSKIIMRYAVDKYSHIFAACSFGKDSRVIVDLAIQVKPELEFIGIDTGYEFPETLSFASQLVKETGMNFHWVRPSRKEAAKIDAAYGADFIKNDQYKCCAMKLPAIKPELKSHNAWISGLRRDEAVTRKDTAIIEESGSIVKINPIAFWAKDDVWQYIKENNLKYHPLYDQGYVSLGCQPCTKKTDAAAGEAERSGRFIMTNHQGKECGLHLQQSST